MNQSVPDLGGASVRRRVDRERFRDVPFDPNLDGVGAGFDLEAAQRPRASPLQRPRHFPVDHHLRAHEDLGGHAVFMDHRDARIGSREAIKDVAKNLERWFDGIVARTFKHRAVTELAQNSSIPVINGLTDFLHPCQGLSDFFTLHEKWQGAIQGKRLCYVGDGNNTCHSLIYTGAKLGAHVTVCTPEGYEPNARVVSEAMLTARDTQAEIRIMNDPAEATEGADAIYTDVWASMGQEDEIEERAALFQDYQVDEKMMARTNDAMFMHCLPAHRGAEVTSGVMDGPRSIVYDIAENRLHVQKALLVLLMRK